jgi:pimeloyl-ACP methyl ester carboxylesterase
MRSLSATLESGECFDMLEHVQEGYAETGLGRIHYVTAGNGPLLVLLHGGYGGWEHWHANILPLAERHTVVAPDMPGFGSSCDIDNDVSVETYAQHVWEAICAIRATLPLPTASGPVHIAAFSFGTAVAAMLALKQPDTVSGVILVNPPGLGAVPQEVKELQARAATTARSAGLRAGVEITLHEFMLCQPSRADAFAGALLERCVRRCRFVSRSLSRTTPLSSLLPAVRVPVHIVLGEQDPHQRSQLAERSARVREMLGPDALTVFSDTAHWLQYEQPERFNALALGWFAAFGAHQSPALQAFQRGGASPVEERRK